MASRTGPKEVTRREFNAQAGVATPKQPSVPACAQHVWDWWWELNARRGPGFETIAPITYSDLYHWLLLTGKYVMPEEIDWLIQLDNAWLAIIIEERDARQERERNAH